MKSKRFWGILKRSICLILALVTLLMCGALVSCDDRDDEEDDEEEDKPAGIVKNGKTVAITFDDGPHNVYTTDIVDELNKYGYHATFFVIGSRIDGTEYNGKAGLTYAYENGNEIAIHGYSHTLYYNSCTDEEYEFEVGNTDKVIKNVLKDCNVRLMRPIGGAITAERVEESEYSVILWDVDSEDWKNKYRSDDTEKSREEKVEAIVNNVMSQVEDGSIILLHDIYESTYDATKIILKRLHEEGYDVVSVSELLGNPVAGKKYSRADVAVG